MSSIDKFSGMNDDEVMDIATDPSISEKLANEAMEEIERREKAQKEMAQRGSDLSEKLEEPERALTNDEIVKQWKEIIEEKESSEFESDEPTDVEAEGTDDDLIGQNIERSELMESAILDEYDDESDNMPTRTKMFRHHFNPIKKTGFDRRQKIREMRENAHNDEQLSDGETAEGKMELKIRNGLDKYLQRGFLNEMMDGKAINSNAEAAVRGYESKKYAYDDDEFDAVIQKMPERLSDIEADAEQERKARIAAYRQALAAGVFYETAEDGTQKAVYAVPDKIYDESVKIGEQTEKFIQRYGEQNSPAYRDAFTYMHEKGLDFEDAETRDASYKGFAKIFMEMADGADLDQKQLDKYYDAFKYGDHLDTLAPMMTVELAGHDVAMKMLNNYLYTKITGEQRKKEFEELPVIVPESEENAEANEGNEVVEPERVNIFEEDIPAGYQMSKDMQSVIDYFSKEFGVDYEDIDKRIVKYIDGLIVDDEYQGGLTMGGQPGPKKRLTKEEWAARQRIIKAKYVALLFMCDRLRKSGVDPNAEVFVTRKNEMRDKRYVVLRFGCDGYNHAIAEQDDSVVGAMYGWVGQDSDYWKNIFCANMTRTDIRNRPDIITNNHRDGIVGLRSVMDRMVDKLWGAGVISDNTADVMTA